MLAVYAEGIGLTIVVVIITFLSLVLGELVPERIGLGNPEGIAIVMAKPLHRPSVIAGPVVRVLSISTEALLRMLGRNPAEVATITEEEIKLRVQDELSAEVCQHVETRMVESVLRLDTLPVRDFMTPRATIIWLDQHDPPETVSVILLSARCCIVMWSDSSSWFTRTGSIRRTGRLLIHRRVTHRANASRLTARPS